MLPSLVAHYDTSAQRKRTIVRGYSSKGLNPVPQPLTINVNIYKANDDEFLLDGTPLAKLQLLSGLSKCGFDIFIVQEMLPRLKNGGTWTMCLTSKQIKTIKNASISTSSGTGFGS